MPTGLLFDADVEVGEFIFKKYVQYRQGYNRALGIIKDGKLVGGVLFQNWNGANVEASYYGHNTLTPGILKCLAEFIVKVFGVARVTVTTSKRHRRLIRALQNLGFLLEGGQKCFYGHEDTKRNTAIRLVMFRDRLDQIAGVSQARTGT